VIEGDTELGLFLKNALDAIDWEELPKRLLGAFAPAAKPRAAGRLRRPGGPPRREE
jgi:predicted lipid carrier protein YhbT